MSLAPRFAAAYASLALIVGASAAALVILVRDPPAAWRPTATGLAGARQIAHHVAGRYRLADGRRMADVWTSSTHPIAQLVVPGRHGGIRNIAVTGQVQYTICGQGGRFVGCSLPSRGPWQRRALLIRGQALELAALTFEYLPEIHAVVVGYPTRMNVVGFQVFERQDFQPSTVRKLAARLSGPLPPRPGLLSAATRADIDRWTLPTAYQLEANVPRANGTLVFVLGRLRWPLPPSRY